MPTYQFFKMVNPKHVESALGLQPGSVSFKHRGGAILEVTTPTLTATQFKLLGWLMGNHLGSSGTMVFDTAPVKSKRAVGSGEFFVVALKLNAAKNRLIVTYLNDDFTEGTAEFQKVGP